MLKMYTRRREKMFSFQVTVNDLAACIEKIREEVAKQPGATFQGDTTQGNFSGPTGVGTVEGNYTAKENIVTITITKKPFVVPQGTIERRMREWFNS
jgi:hypothetical protein